MNSIRIFALNRSLLARASAFGGLCLASLLLLAACSLPWQHPANAASIFGPHPKSQQILTTMQQNFRGVSAFHVALRVQNEGQAPASQIQIRNADGDVVMPDKVKAQATVMLSGQAVAVTLISVGQSQFITDPITGQWRVVKGVLDPRTLTNPDTGIISLVGKLQKISAPSADTVNGTPCWRVTGQLKAQELAFFTGGGLPKGTMLQASVCVGKADALPYAVDVTGTAAKGDTPQTSRSFLLSNYNENISIAAPQV